MSSLMSIGLRAMTANYAALQTTGHNIANAGVEGYSRQSVQLATSTGQFTGAGFFGKGVDVVDVKRAHDRFLTMQANVATSLAAMDAARAQQLSQLEGVFPPGESGLGYAVGEFLNAFGDVVNDPDDLSAREVVLARAQEVSLRFSSASASLDSLQNGVTEDLRHSTESINALTQQIAGLNEQIAKFNGLDQTPNDLLDARDRAISDLSGYLQVTTVAAEDGSVGVFAAGGQRLVLGDDAQELAVIQDTFDPSRSALAIVEGGRLRSLGGEAIGGGSIAGLLRFQNEDLVDARISLGQMASALAATTNQAQAYGLDLRVPPGAGSPIFSVGAPQALPANTNTRTSSGDFASSISLTVVDATVLEASDYELRPDPAGPTGTYTLTRMSDGLVRSVQSGDEVDGMRIDVGTPAPDPNDRFLLRPVAYAAGEMQRTLADPRGIAAASPLTATTGVGNVGTATVASLAVVDDTVNPELTASIVFTSETGDYTWELRDRTTNALVSSGTDTWTAGEPIALNGFELELAGVPSTGDSLEVGKTLQTESNNGNAIALMNLRDQRFVGRTLDANGAPAGGMTITDAYAAAMADVGVRAQSANMTMTMSAAAANQANFALTSTTGVNLDEEAANLIQFQQSYQAAAKVLQVAQSVFDTMLQLGGR
jgi:flagellar hook-associated protein 1